MITNNRTYNFIEIDVLGTYARQNIINEILIILIQEGV